MKNPLRLSFTGALLAALISAPSGRAEDPSVAGEALVIFKAGVASKRAEHSLQQRGLALAKRFDRLSKRRDRVAALVRDGQKSTATLLSELRADPSVQSAEPNYLRQVRATGNDPDFSRLWGLRNNGQVVNGIAGSAGADIRFDEAWALSRPTSGEVVVGVVDTGVDVTHPDLAANLWSNPGEIAGNLRDDDGNGRIDDVHGFDFALNTGTMTDSGDHGTHVAGTIAATRGNGLGITGVQPHAKILALKVSTDGNSLATDDILAAFDYAIELKERGVNLVAVNASYGGTSSTAIERAGVESLRDAGIILCAAAGNDGMDNDVTANYPANYPVSNVVSVAATTSTNLLASFSNYGKSQVDLGAPGTNIHSTRPMAAATRTSSFKFGAASYTSAPVDGSGWTGAEGITRPLHGCGLGRAGDFPAGVAGNLALIQRGTITFAEKVANARLAGATGVVIHDNVAAAITDNPWTLNGLANALPTVRISQADGLALLATGLPASATVGNFVDASSAFQFMNGTSMATPHVAGAVAFAALNFPSETVAQRISRLLTHVTPVPALAGKVVTGGTLNLLGIVDADSDGLPDWWETDHFGSLAAQAAGDGDSDGVSNLEEWLAGSSPAEGPSVPRIDTVVADPSTQDMIVRFTAASSRSYQLQRSDNLVEWLPLGAKVSGRSGTIEVRDPNARAVASRRFYRLLVAD
jgi:subtilisin family serine protease